MKNWRSYLIFATCAFAMGCAKTRSISNSGYQPGNHYGDGTRTHELDEFDVLGISRDNSVSEEEIRQAIANAQRVKLKPGSSILLIQSGAVYPDGPMLTELSKHFAVVPFSGVAVDEKEDPVRRRSTVRNAAIVTDPDKPVTIANPNIFMPIVRCHQNSPLSYRAYGLLSDTSLPKLDAKSIPWLNKSSKAPANKIL